MQIFEHIKKAADERRLGLHKNSLCRAGRIRTHNLLTINQALYQFRATALQSKQKLHKKFPLWMWVGPSHRPRARRARALPAELHIHKENSKEQKFQRFVLAATYFPQCVSSIIGAIAFNFRVRNGTGWFHDAKPPKQKVQISIHELERGGQAELASGIERGAHSHGT